MYIPTVTRLAKYDISHRQFFFSENLPASAYSVHHAYAPVQKVDCHVENIVPEMKNATLGHVVLLDDGTYRAYGMVRTTDWSNSRIGVWESQDALNWHPRILDQVEVHGQKTNLIRFDGLPGDQSFLTHPNVLPLNDGRWRMYFWKHRDGHLRYLIAESEDGLHWTLLDLEKPALYHPADGRLWKLAEGLSPNQMTDLPVPADEILARKRLWSNDATNVYYNEHMGRFECYSVWLHPAIPDRRVDVDNAPGVHRLIHRRLSDDGINWSDPELIIMPDQRDPWDLQFYFMQVQWHEDWMIGSIGYYRVEDGQQTMDTDLCFSRDGRRWERPVRGGWIPRSPEESGAMDTKGIYGWTPWILQDNQWLALCVVTPDPHNRQTRGSAMSGVRFARNRFVGIAAGQTPGGFMTEPFFVSPEGIKVDATIRGWLRAELCDAFGRKITGFHLMDSVPIKGNSEEHLLRWKNASISDHYFECVRLRFEFADGEIWGIQF